MLISHKKHFIFTKTAKTAGTSVESYFEQYCMLEGEWLRSHFRDEYISEAGIIGYRGYDRNGATWYNHMPAKKIRDLIGRDIWDEYFTFTVVRNPFDKLISGFFFMVENIDYKQRVNGSKKPSLNGGRPVNKIKESPEIERFRLWVRNGGAIIDRDKYMIDKEECIDYFIRFEELHSGIKHVCNHLSIPFEPSHVPELKKGYRHHRIPIRDYYDQETKQIVEKRYAWELERFGYYL
jgi:Sulfotransferase family